ncbi:testis-expressed protein 47-like isoform X2 [Crotalus tigris]|uniref:testis-expressed protein 47-like isoform X2 n=1 Tax=Crotalus tigris TaxID=88082 RepID=UPI00192FB12B|nr:testis-expressed protein 47-like isoform X2 [Crotalus tigris]
MADMGMPSVARNTLLSALEERRRQQMKKYLLHRLIFVAMLQENASEGEITAYRQMKQVLLTPVRKIIMNSFSRRFHDPIWGKQPRESFSSTPRAYSTFWRALLRDIKILVMSHNIPTRLFSQWHATKVEVPVTLEDVTQSQTTEEVITECLTLILKLGVYLATLKVGNKSLGECLHTAVPELLIPAETIQYLCRSQECLSPTEFLKMYNNPSQPQMDSETVWPTPTHMST